ncbi:hypothetical protein [Nocardioides zeae]|uniref:Uncharacterized protein (DUF983 family) n=1 Tax=Nocardioides zeae TaxID=1457234 RepID=A0AAJ1X1C4_9ACTN|nr:hypothetical protein [Nocardioides zeae]MDQ1103254.1 uncharacterized protein (DUF983 family) [Nocardioides zeae]
MAVDGTEAERASFVLGGYNAALTFAFVLVVTIAARGWFFWIALAVYLAAFIVGNLLLLRRARGRIRGH